MKPRHILMGAALAIAAGLAAFGDTTPQEDVAEAVERPAQPARAPDAQRASAASVAILRVQPRADLIGDLSGSGDDLFGSQDWTPPPPPPPTASAGPPPPPVAPPLPFTFIGKSLQDGVWEIYLARGERTHLVRENTVIDGMYRVDAIKPPVLTLTYLPLNQVQQLNIGVFD